MEIPMLSDKLSHLEFLLTSNLYSIKNAEQFGGKMPPGVLYAIMTVSQEVADEIGRIMKNIVVEKV